MSAALVIGVHQEPSQLADRAADTGDVAREGCGDAVTVLGQALPFIAKDDSSVAVELAVAARRVTSREIS
ncbi:MAG TPA: hypothetical protein VIU15_21120 [Streptomyces sp.]